MPYLIVLVLVIVGGVAYYFFQDAPVVVTPEPAPVTRDVEEVEKQNPTSTEEVTTTNDYKNGTYQTEVNYLTPMRDEYHLDVTLTIANDIVTGSDIVYSQGAEKDPNPQRFEAAYRTEIIGKDIDTLNLSRVGGASLTTAAFNNALVKIKTDAKS